MKFEEFLNLEGQVYQKETVARRLSEIFNTEYECTESDVKNEPTNDEDTEYHSVFTPINGIGCITINYDKATNLIVAPLQKN